LSGIDLRRPVAIQILPVEENASAICVASSVAAAIPDLRSSTPRQNDVSRVGHGQHFVHNLFISFFASSLCTICP